MTMEVLIPDISLILIQEHHAWQSLSLYDSPSLPKQKQPSEVCPNSPVSPVKTRMRPSPEGGQFLSLVSGSPVEGGS